MSSNWITLLEARELEKQVEAGTPVHRWGLPDPDFGDGPLDTAKAWLVDGLEDVGGSWDYREFLDAIADPDHEGHDERLQWIDGKFDPADTDADACAQAVHNLAKSGPASQQSEVAGSRSSPWFYTERRMDPPPRSFAADVARLDGRPQAGSPQSPLS